MSVTISQSTLVSALRPMRYIIDTGNIRQLFTCVEFQLSKDRLLLKGTNGTRFLQVSSLIEYDGKDKFVIVPFKSVFKLISKLKGDLKLDITNNKLVIIDEENSKFVFDSVDDYDIPEPQIKTKVKIPIRVDDFKKLTKTIFASSNDISRYSINCVCFDFLPEQKQIVSVATDGTQLIKVWLNNDEVASSNRILIKKDGVNAILECLNTFNIDEFVMNCDDEHMSISSSQFTLVVPLAEGNFPKYSSIDTPHDNIFVINGSHLHKSLDKINSMFSNADESVAVFEYNKEANQIIISTPQTVPYVSYSVPLKIESYEGKSDAINFMLKVKKLYDFSKKFTEEKLQIIVADKNEGPIKFQGRDVIYYLMPVVSYD